MMSNLHFLIKSLRHSVQRSTVMEAKYSEQVTPAYLQRYVCVLIGKSRNLRIECFRVSQRKIGEI